MLPLWKEKYRIDELRIDEQHKELFRLAGFIHRLNPVETTKAETVALLKLFYKQLSAHFHDEEAYMHTIAFPLFREHAQLHDEIIGNLSDVIRAKQKLRELQKNMKHIVEQWLVEHITMHDLKIKLWHDTHKTDEKSDSDAVPKDIFF